MYDELRRLAAAYMRRERPGQTLQATALVHEAYLRLAGAGTPWHDKRHFVGIAARSMRQILVERARARGAQKRWAGLNRVTLSDSLAVAADPEGMLPALDDALARLEQLDPEQARIVELRYFAGLSIEDAADALGMSPATLKRRWALARAGLYRHLSGAASCPPSSSGACATSSTRRSTAIRPLMLRGGSRAKPATTRSSATSCCRSSIIIRAPARFSPSRSPIACRT